MKRSFRLTLGLGLLTPLSLLLALVFGSVTLSWSELWQALSPGSIGLPATLVWELRLPRALSAFAVGGLLALAGSLLQVLLRNPLADPYILGVSGGAAVAALVSMLAGLGAGWIANNAFFGSLLSMLLVFRLSHSQGSWHTTRLLLTGVVVAAGWGAVIAFALSIAPNERLPGMVFWLMGDLSHADHAWLTLVVLVFGLLFCYPFARSLNLLARGELAAAALGVEAKHVKRIIYIAASMFTAVAVTNAGSIGFVGLIIPHLTRLLGATDHRLLLPNAVLLGGSFLVLADTLARTLVAPMQLPVGVITALLGVPLFLYLLSRTRP